MNTLPTHGRINCSRCFAGEVVEFDKTKSTQGDWRITANPMAWGNQAAKVVVLGFSKGPTQAGALASADHDEIAYKGGRTNVGKILEYVGLLSPLPGESASDAVSREIADRNGSFHFGSLIRCTVERFERKDSNWKGSGGGMLDRFVATEFGKDVALNCVKQHLANLSSATRIVVMFGMGQKLNYIDSAYQLFQSALGGKWKRINDVAYTDGNIMVVHVEHFASQGKHIPQWLNATTERGRFGVMARDAVASAIRGVKLTSTSGNNKPIPADTPCTTPRNVKEDKPMKAATKQPSENIDVFSRHLSFVLNNGTELFPVRVKNRQTGKVAFRVSEGGTNGNTKANGLEVEDEMEMVRYVLDLGYSVRASSLDSNTNGLYKARGRAVAEVRIATEK